MKLETLTFKVDASAAAKVIEEYAADVAQIVAQRDELLAALRHIEGAAMDITCDRRAIREAARAAIKKATGGAA
jgi:hypothetical protein